MPSAEAMQRLFRSLPPPAPNLSGALRPRRAPGFQQRGHTFLRRAGGRQKTAAPPPPDPARASLRAAVDAAGEAINAWACHLGKDGDRPAKAEGPGSSGPSEWLSACRHRAPGLQGLLFPEMAKSGDFLPAMRARPRHSSMPWGSDQHGQLLPPADRANRGWGLPEPHEQ